ncbi:MAG: glycosyltransferase family 2 protein [Aliarcobacter cryaerophilus]|jgi:glycosyltransferase involved in cell wall biosynthesis|nr:glycosyltransferase family 2 protein [Aliarcobacter cryaerophilus]
MISVCLATYNGEKYIKEQLLSILKQLDSSDEVIISDDHSTDNTLEVIKSLDDSRIKIFVNNKEKGYTRNFENALEKASGDIIFLSDQDDVWMDDKVKVCVEELDFSDFVVHDGNIVDGDLKMKDNSIFKFRNARKGFLVNFINIKYLGCCMVFKKSVLNKALPFPKDQYLTTHDSWLTLVAEMYFKVSLIEKPLILYRRHGENTSLGGASGTNSLLKKLEIRFYSLYHLIKIYFRGGNK